MKTLLRVSTMNNFNFTCNEYKQLEKYKDNYNVFVNSNSFIPIDNKYKSFITINPYLNKFIKPRGNISNVKAFRIKYVHNANEEVKKAFIESINYANKVNIPVLITLQRFKSKNSLYKYTLTGGGYKWIKNYFRLLPGIKENICKQFKSLNYRICDETGGGCPECNNCYKLSYNNTGPIYEINLSSSGLCKFNCPDCFAHILIKKNNGRLKFDTIKQNAKMKVKVK